MEPTLTLMRVNRLIRTAVGLVKGMQLRQSQDSFEMIVLSGILWFKVTKQTSALLHLEACSHRHAL